MLELSHELNERSSLFELADVALLHLMGHLGCSRAAVWLMSENGADEAVLVRSQGMPEAVARGLGVLWGPWFVRRGVLSGDIIDVRQLNAEDTPGLELATQARVAVLAPLTAHGRLLGFVVLGARISGTELDVVDREVFRASLNLLGMTIQNTFLYNRAMENNRRLRLANERLVDADRLKSEFLQNMNHELRTPLTIVGAYVDALLHSETADSALRGRLQAIQDQMGELRDRVLSLLDFSSLERDELETDLTRTEVAKLVRRFYKERLPGVTAALRELRFSTASEVPHALCDGIRATQILDALVDNAVKFAPPGARIHLRVDWEPAAEPTGQDWVRIDVEDDGPGIPKDRLAQVFESFRQGDGSTTREHGGMGLGLALAQRLARKMNGDLTATSTPGEGTTFTLRLPAA